MQKRLASLSKRVINTYGTDVQIEMAIEEMAELTLALQHLKRGRSHNCPEEVADVLITVNQLRLIFDPSTIDKFIAQKLDRLEASIDSHTRKVPPNENP